MISVLGYRMSTQKQSYGTNSCISKLPHVNVISSIYFPVIHTTSFIISWQENQEAHYGPNVIWEAGGFCTFIIYGLSGDWDKMNGSKPGQLQPCSPQKAVRGYLKLRGSGNYNPACNSPKVRLVTSFFSSSQDTSCFNSSRDFSTFVQLYQHENNLVCRYIFLCLEVIFADDFRIQ